MFPVSDFTVGWDRRCNLGCELRWRCTHWHSRNQISGRQASNWDFVWLWQIVNDTESCASGPDTVPDRKIPHVNIWLWHSCKKGWGLCSCFEVFRGVVHISKSKGINPSNVILLSSRLIDHMISRWLFIVDGNLQFWAKPTFTWEKSGSLWFTRCTINCAR